MNVLDRCRAVATSTWSDALDSLGLRGVIPGLTLRSGSGRVAGWAATVKETVGEYPVEAFAVGDILDLVQRDSMLVFDLAGEPVSSFGGLAALAAVQKGAAGVMIDGACRDVDEIRNTGLWLASRYVTPLSGKGRINVTSGNIAVTVCGIPVNPGDCIVGDETGIVCIPAARLEEALAIAEDLTARDAKFAEALRAGESFRSAAARLRHL